ncbi:MAG: helix-turn-helix transcriptional regulator [Candidatus Eremiobacteraeota bacterium]|nr:helix-turn-helix transcriptional regulator [Candidatus Eremiobacteraeota bacterium]
MLLLCRCLSEVDKHKKGQVASAYFSTLFVHCFERTCILVYGGEAMRSKCSRPPVEPLSARILRLRIARGYSADELAVLAQVPPGAIRRLEAGKQVDKSVLPALAAALGVSYCFLICGEHSCAERACISPLLIYKPSVIASLAAHAGRKAALRRRHLR